MARNGRHIDQCEFKKKRVFFTGTASTTYRLGTAVAYDRDYGTAADADESRDSRVEPFSQSNNNNFAGVLSKDVTVDVHGNGEWVVIYEPGGCAYVALGSDTTINSTYLWAVAGTGGAGRWRADRGTGIGRGCALALQTNASGVLGESIDGTAVVTATAVTDTGLFTGAAAGDYLVIMSAAQADGDADGTPGVYTIASVTDTANAVLSTSASTSATEFMGYVISGNPTCLAYLFDGPETGGIEWIEMLDNAASQSMVGGFTHAAGGSTLGDGDCTATLANGTAIGQMKGYALHGALTTQDYLVSVTAGVQMDGSTALNSLELDGDADESLLEWVGTSWKLIANSGTTLA